MRSSSIIASIAFVSILGVARANDDPVSDDERWRDAVHTFAAGLADVGGRAEFEKVVTAHSWCAPFARNRSEAVTVLPERLRGLTLIGIHAYLQPAISAASDLIADVNANPNIAPAVRKRVVPPEGVDVRPADATMARWFATALDAQPADPVALIVFYDPGQATAESTGSPTLVLVIARGSFSADGAPSVDRTLYGPLEAAVK